MGLDGYETSDIEYRLQDHFTDPPTLLRSSAGISAGHLSQRGTPFSFSDAEYVRTVLTSAGFKDIVTAPHDEAVTSGDVDAMTRVLLSVGPLGKIARETPSIKAAVEPKLREALAGLGDPSRVELVASVWIVAAWA